MNLGARYWRFSRKVNHIADGFRLCVSNVASDACRQPHELGQEAAAIQLQDHWSSFCRDLVYASWKGGVFTLGGQVIPVRAGDLSYERMLQTLRSTFIGRAKKARYWEPKWFDPTQTIDVARRLSVVNLANISLGLGLTPSPLEELRAVRNYFAHRGKETSQRLRPFVSFPVTDVVARAHLTQVTRGGALTFERWAAQMDTMSRAAVL